MEISKYTAEVWVKTTLSLQLNSVLDIPSTCQPEKKKTGHTATHRMVEMKLWEKKKEGNWVSRLQTAGLMAAFP